MKRRILVAYSMESTFNQATLEYLNAFRLYLAADVDYLHVTHDAKIAASLTHYDVIIHSYCARLCFPGYVSADFLARLKSFSGLKVLAVQDEYDRTDVLRRVVRDVGFDVVLTCVPQDSLEYVYPRAEFPDVRFETVLTGYVSDAFGESHESLIPLQERPVVVGYRGRDLGGLYGRLGFEKYEIGRRMKEVCQQRGISHDIAMDDQSRIYGPAWFDFIGSCRSMLGSESGSNVFDFDGSLRRRFDDLAGELGRLPSYSDFLPVIRERDSEISMGQISPRVFECALMRTPMILFRGRYSDVIEPEIHYIPLEKDFSNVDEVLDRLERFDDLEAMTTRTYDHLVRSGHFGYRAYVQRIAEVIEEEIARRSTAAADLSKREEGDAVLAAASRWKWQTPTKEPQPASLFRLNQGKELFECYYNEVAKLEQLEADTLARFHHACARLAESLTGDENQLRLGHFRQLLDDVETQFRFLAAERSGLREQVSGFADITSLPEMNQLVATYENQAKVLMGIYDKLNTDWGRLVGDIARTANRPVDRARRRWRSLRTRLVSILRRNLHKG